jgi:hypothetical protein
MVYAPALQLRHLTIGRGFRRWLIQQCAGAGDQIGICCVFRWAATKSPFSQRINQLSAQGAVVGGHG